MRLAKHLAHAGVASRRAAEALIAAGRVTIDGATVTDPARDVSGDETIAVDGEALGAAPPNRLPPPRCAVQSPSRARGAAPPVGERALRALCEGVELDDGRTAPA